jgi:hypothetical protein
MIDFAKKFPLLPRKKSDSEILSLLDEKIRAEEYFFTEHAKSQCKKRDLLELEVLDILEGKIGSKRKRNANKDLYEKARRDWNHCIEGINPDNQKIRIVFTFFEEMVPIITVIVL